MKVLVFTSRDDSHDGYESAKRLVSDLGHVAKLVTKTGFVLADLHLCVKYRIVETPTVLVTDEKGAVKYRKTGGLVGAEVLKELL